MGRISRLAHLPTVSLRATTHRKQKESIMTKIMGFDNLPYVDIPIDKLFCETYQREQDSKMVADIDKNFNAHLFTPPEVAEVAGRYAIIDGAHRWQGAKAKDWTHIRCRVHAGLTYEQRAMLFEQFQTRRRKVSAVVRHRARVEAKNEIAVRVEQAVSAAGFRITARKDADRGIHEVADLYLADREGALREALRVRKDAWQFNPCPASLFGGISVFIGRNKEKVDLDRLIKKLTPLNPFAMRRDVTQGLMVGGGQMPKYVCNAVAELYNKGLPISKQCPGVKLHG